MLACSCVLLSDIGSSDSYTSTSRAGNGCSLSQHFFATHLLETGYDIRNIQDLPDRKDIGTAMIRTHVLNRRGTAC